MSCITNTPVLGNNLLGIEYVTCVQRLGAYNRVSITSVCHNNDLTGCAVDTLYNRYLRRDKGFDPGYRGGFFNLYTVSKGVWLFIVSESLLI